VENPLAQEILAGKFGPKVVIEVDVAGDELVFRKKRTAGKKAGVA